MAKAVACQRPSDPAFTDEQTVQLSTPQTSGAIDINRLFNPLTEDIRLGVDHTLPTGISQATRTVRILSYAGDDGVEHNGGVINGPTAINVSTPTQYEFAYTPPDWVRTITFQASLDFCNGHVDDVTTVECPSVCKMPQPPTGSSHPISYEDGNAHYSDSDPLPLLLDAVRLNRNYDSHQRIRGSFGRGWVSIFDSRLFVLAEATGDTISMTDENNESFVFMRRNGVYTQMWPKGRTSAGTLAFDAMASLYVHRPAGAGTARLYRSSDGRFVGLRDISSGREVRITYDANGLPQSVKDSWTDVTWNVTVNAATKRVTAIETAGLTWQYSYVNDNLIGVLAPGSSTWRTYEYTNDRLTAAKDALGNLIEGHTYDAYGRTMSESGARDEIDSIQYGAAGTSSTQLVTRITMKSGVVSEFTLRPIGGSWRTVSITGGCSACGSRDGVFAYDVKGHLTREQNASGYITVRTYDGERIVSTQQFLRPAGCNPDTAPLHCMLDASTLPAASLESTSATITTSYEYQDAHWPDKPTAVVTPSVVPGGTVRREIFAYHPLTGVVISHGLSGWTETGQQGSQLEEHTTSTILYGDDPSNGNTSSQPAFTPGGNFQSSWLTLPQPQYLRKSVDGPRKDVSDVTSFVYYPVHSSVPATLRGRLAAVRNAAGHITRYESYDIFGNATRIVDPNGAATEMTFDSLGRMLTSTIKGVSGCDTAYDALCATDLTTTRAYDPPAGPLQSEQRPLGGVTKYTYDSRGRVLTMSRGPALNELRERIKYDYDPSSGLTSAERIVPVSGATQAEKKKETYGDDALPQLQTVTHADATAIHYAYDQEGRLSSVRDENHASPNTTYTYDPAGRVATVKQTLVAPNIITTAYSYDIQGTLRTVTDPKGNVTTYNDDDFGRLLSQQSPVTGTTTYLYDAASNLTTSRDANNATTQRSYDALNRLITATSSSAGLDSETVEYSYDQDCGSGNGVGRLATMTDHAGLTSYCYERRGRLAVETRDNPSSGYAPIAMTYGYDADANRNRIVYPAGRIAEYGFDFADRPASMTVDGLTILSSATYLPFGPATQLAFGNGMTKTMSFDSRYRPIMVQLAGATGTVAQYTYASDAAGNITQIHDAVNAAYNRDLIYDDLNRLTEANTGAALWGAGTYQYDEAGNMTSLHIGSRTLAFSYAGTTSKLSGVTGTTTESVSYDAAGNELSSMTYSARNLLQGISGSASDPDSVEFLYDGRGVRIGRSWIHSSRFGYLRLSSYSPELNLLWQSDWQQAVQPVPVGSVPGGTDYFWLAGQPVAQASSDSRMELEESLRFTFTDHLGTPTLQTDLGGAIVWRAEYEPFGRVYEYRAGLDGDTQILRFPGQESLGSPFQESLFEDDTKPRYNIFRWYRAGWGRYTQADPIGVLGSLRLDQLLTPLSSAFLSRLGSDGLPRIVEKFSGPFFQQAPGLPANLYAYVDGNPTRYVDPMGLERVLCTVFREHAIPINSPYGSLPGNNCRFTGTCGGGPSDQIYTFEKKDPFIYRFNPPCKECPLACIFEWETTEGMLLTNPPLCYGQVPVNNRGGFTPGGGRFRGRGASGGW